MHIYVTKLHICPSQSLVFVKLDPWEGQIVYNLHYLAIEDIQIFALSYALIYCIGISICTLYMFLLWKLLQFHICSGIEDIHVHSTHISYRDIDMHIVYTFRIIIVYTFRDHEPTFMNAYHISILWSSYLQFSLYFSVSLQYFTTHTDLVKRQQQAIRQRKAVRKGLQSDKEWTGDGFVKESESMVSN